MPVEQNGGMNRANAARRQEQELVRQCYAGLTLPALQTEVLHRLRGLVPADAVFLATADPATLLFTSAVTEEPLAAEAMRFLDNEFGQPDVNKFQSLAIAATPVSTLDAATGGERARSIRYRDIMAPIGLGDELRAALVADSGCWGYICMHREDGPAGFTAKEARLLARLGPHLAEGFRRALAPPQATTSSESAPGVVILGPDLSVLAVTPQARYWLSQFIEPPSESSVPVAVRAAAVRLVAIGRGDSSGVPTVRVPSRSGGWLQVHASPLVDADGDRTIAVVIEPVPANEAAQLLLTTCGLTARETEVANLVLRGMTTRQITGQLHISPHTVQDHLKSIFDKTGVRSRHELVTQMLGRHAPAGLLDMTVYGRHETRTPATAGPSPGVTPTTPTSGVQKVEPSPSGPASKPAAPTS